MKTSDGVRLSVRLREARVRMASSLCCGLDPDPQKIPTELLTSLPLDQAVTAFMRAVVDATKDFVCAYKIQRAYFDLLDHPKKALIDTIEYVRSVADVPIIFDCKIGETENTTLAYLTLCISQLGLDGVVVNPYMGSEILSPFLDEYRCGAVVLVRTSNAGAGLFQDVKLDSGEFLWERVMREVVTLHNSGGNVVPVLASTANIEWAERLAGLPGDMPVFIAGFGAQGGSMALLQTLSQLSLPFIVNSSRAIIFAPTMQKGMDWKTAVGEAAESARNTLANL